MKQLETTCQVCRRSMTIEVEEPAMFSDDVMCAMAVCDSCHNDHDEAERNRISKYNKAIERECSESPKRAYKLPYAD